MSVPSSNDPRTPNVSQPTGVAYGDTILAAKSGRTTVTPVAAAPPDDVIPPVPLSEAVRALPLAIQGIWVGLICIVLLVGSAAALRSLFGGTVVAAPLPAPTSTATTVAPTATVAAVTPTAEPTASSTAGATLSIGGGNGGPSGAFGALAIRDRLATHVRLRKIGPFVDDLNRLHDVEPTAIERADLRKMIADTAVFAMTPGAAGQVAPDAERLFTFLTGRAGAAGPDILFDLVTTRGGSRAATHADELLRREDVLAKGTAAFKIANDLRVTTACPDRVKLFDRVKADGDNRVLQFLFQMGKCGRVPGNCCLSNDPAHKEVIRVITAKK